MTVPITPLDPWICRKLNVTGKLTRQALEEYQLAKLQQTLDLVRSRSAFYRDRLRGTPQGITSLKELADFPFTTAEDIRQQGMKFLCASQSEIERVVTLDTSGTTGAPKRLFFTRADQELTIDFFQAGMSTFTAPGDRVMVLLPCKRPGSVGDLLALAMEGMGCVAVRHGVVRDTEETLAVIKVENVNVLVGIPVQVLALARCNRGLCLKSVLLSTDHVSSPLAASIEAKWGCLVYNHYGMTEMGLGGGVECQARRGYHLREADMYFEIIDPLTGRSLPDGEEGEVVFTTLTRQGMPLVRYRTGDISRFIMGECPCGTCLKTLQQIRSRRDGWLQVGRQGGLTMADLDDALFALDALDDFEVTLIHLPDVDELRLKIYGSSPDWTNREEEIESALATISALRSGMSEGRIKLHIEFMPENCSPAAPSKRRIEVIGGDFNSGN